MIRFKEYIKNRNLRVVDFRDKKPKSLRSVDFRDKKNKKVLKEQIHGPTKNFNPVMTAAAKKSVEHKLDDHLNNHYKYKDEHKEALKHYTLDHDSSEPKDIKKAKSSNHHPSLDINHHLHSNSGKAHPNHENHVKKLDDAIKSNKAPKDFHVYSGLHQKPSAGKHVHHGYMSTSTNHDQAKRFACDSNKDGHHHMLKIKIKKGSKHGAMIGNHSEFPEESEFLVKRGAKLKVHPKPETFKTKAGVHYHIHHAEIVE